MEPDQDRGWEECDANTVVLSGEFTVNTTLVGTQRSSHVAALDNGNFIAVWISQVAAGTTYEVRGRIFDANGSPISVNGGTDDFIINTTSDGVSSAAVATLLDGRFVVSWDSGISTFDVHARIFNADATPSTVNGSQNDFIADNTDIANQYLPTVAPLPSGGFAIGWTSSEPNTGGSSVVRTRFFDLNGLPIGDDFVVNTTSVALQSQIVTLDSGHLIEVWSSLDTMETPVRGRVLDDAGYPIGDDFLLTRTPVNSITNLGDDKFLAAWDSYVFEAGSFDVHAQTFSVSVACYCRGTQILTTHEEVAIEKLKIGDHVATLSGEMRPIKWIGRRAYHPRFVADNRAILPIRIMAGALGEGVPLRDLSVSPEHALYIDGLLVPARLLINGETIVQDERVDALEYFHIELDGHDVLIADGAPAESYAECNSRSMFYNAHEFMALYPNDAASFCFCAPRIEEGSPKLVRIRARLARVAEHRDAA